MKPVLIYLRPLDQKTGQRIDVRVADAPSADAYGTGGTPWAAAVITRPTLSIELMSPDMDGRVQAGQCRFDIALTALFTLPRALSLYWKGAAVVIHNTGPLEGPTAVPDFWGYVTAARLDLETGRLAVTAEVSTALIDKPLLTKEFTGGGGINGDAGRRGVLLPMGMGAVKNIQPVWFDLTRNIGMIDGYGNTLSIDWLGEGLSSFGARVADYPTYAALANAIDTKAIKPGQWGTCVAEGLVGLGAPPVGTITVHATFGFNRAGAMMKRVLSAHALVPAARLDSVAFDALDAAIPYPTHFWTDQQRNTKDLIESIAQSCNATPLVSFQNRVTVTRAVLGNPVATLDRSGQVEPRVINWASADVDPPYYVLKARARRPASVLTDDQVNFVDTLEDKGVYAAATVYRAGNLVWLADGSQWLYQNASPASGHAPPSTAAPDGNGYVQDAWWFRRQPPKTASDFKYADGTPVEALKPRQAGADPTANNQAASIAGQAATATDSSFGAITGVTKPGDYAGRVLDTRADDRPPSYYYALGLGERQEFKNAGFSGSGANGYGHLLTVTQWINSSGGPVKQTLTDSLGVIYERYSTSDAAWSAWQNNYNGFFKPAFGVDLLESRTGTPALATLAAFKTLLGQAASISGQGAFATVNSAAYGSTLLTGFGALAPLASLVLGDAYLFRADGSTRLTDANTVTALGQAASISGQGAFATISSAGYGSSFLTGFGALAPLASIAFGSSYLLEAAGGAAATLAAFKTSLGQASSISGQGSGATANSLDQLNAADALRFRSLPTTVLDIAFASYADKAALMKDWGDARNGWGAEVSFVTDVTVPGGAYPVIGDNAGNDEAWMFWKGEPIFYEPNALYEVAVWSINVAGGRETYCGLEGLAADKVTRVNFQGNNDYGGQHYVAISGATAKIALGYVRGKGATGTTTERSDPQNPGVMQNGVVYVRPMFLCNYSQVAGRTGIARIRVRRIDGGLQLQPSVAFGSAYLTETAGGAIASLSVFKTSLGTASSISGQGAFATINSAAYGSTLLTGFGALAPLGSIAFGSNYLLEQAGGALATLSAFKTSLGTASSITGQGSFATKSTALWATEISGVGKPQNNATNGQNLMPYAPGLERALVVPFGNSSVVFERNVNFGNNNRDKNRIVLQAGQNAALFDDSLVPVQPGEVMFGSCAANPVNVGDTVQLFAYFYTPDGNRTTGAAFTGSRQPLSYFTNGNWSIISGRLTVPDGCTHMRMGIERLDNPNGNWYAADGYLGRAQQGATLGADVSLNVFDGTALLARQQLITALGQAGSISGQGALATMGAIAYGSSYLTSLPLALQPGSFFPSGYMYASAIYQNAGQANLNDYFPATTGADKTGNANAAGFAGQGALATLNAVNYSNQINNLPQSLLYSNMFNSGGNYYLSATAMMYSTTENITVESLRPQERGGNKTETRNAAGFSGQTAWATFTRTTTVVAMLRDNGRVSDPTHYNTQSILGPNSTTNLTPSYTVNSNNVTVNLPSHNRVIAGLNGPITLGYGAGSGVVAFSSYWVAYIDDPDLQGNGSPSINFSGDANVLLYPGRYQIASGVAPAANGGGGTVGGGGGGGPGNYNDNCVAAIAWVETYQHGWIQARDVAVGDLLRVLTDDLRETRWEPCEANRLAIAAGVRLTTASGIALDLAASTPIVSLQLRDNIRAPDANGLDLPVWQGGLFWEETAVEDLGEIEVAHISCDANIYLAGNVAERGIFTHNIRNENVYKP